MSNGTAPVQPAPVPPSIEGIEQPVFGSGSATSPATPIDITGSPIIPPPTIGDPVGVPTFPPEAPDTAPVAVPTGPLVGPAISPAPVPPSVPGYPQPQFETGDAADPSTMFPGWTLTDPPYPPIVFANIFNMGAVPPPATATTPVIPWEGAVTPGPPEPEEPEEPEEPPASPPDDTEPATAARTAPKPKPRAKPKARKKR
jgi:hypothetical protein